MKYENWNIVSLIDLYEYNTRNLDYTVFIILVIVFVVTLL